MCVPGTVLDKPHAIPTARHAGQPKPGQTNQSFDTPPSSIIPSSFDIEKVEQGIEAYDVQARYNARFIYRGGRSENVTGTAHFKVYEHSTGLAIQEAEY